MQWIVASSFHVGDGWITGLVDPASHRFTAVEPGYRHDRSRPHASLADWRDYLVHAWRAWRAADRGGPGRVGIVTVFPQLAVLVGCIKRVLHSDRPIVAMMFNLGRTYGGMQGRLARFGLRAVDRFVVHSTHEIDVYSEWLGLPRERFVFLPLSIDEKPVALAEDVATPFVLSMGSANRDYRLLMRVLSDLGYPAVVIAGRHALDGVAVPSNVTVSSELPIEACHDYCQRALVSIVPLADTRTAAGQVSVLEAMMYGRPVIATRSVGTVDYLEDGVDGLLVPPDDPDALRSAIASLWSDAPRRAAVGAAARRSALGKFTFRAVARELEALLDQVAARGAPRSGDLAPTPPAS